MFKRLFGVILAFVLAGCGNQQPLTSPGVRTEPIDPATLGPTVNVQSVAAVKDQEGVLVLDVREQWEYDQGHIPGVKLIPMTSVPSRLTEIPRDQTVILTCRSGNRSGQVTDYLRQQGFTNVHNMQGGILAWQKAGLPVER